MKLRLEAITVLLLISFLAMAQDKESFVSLNAEEFYQKLISENLPVLIDSRPRENYLKDRIPGAILAESKEVLIELADTLDRDRPLFIYCEFNQRSPAACSLLFDKGFRNVYNLEGGLIRWKELEYEMDRKKIKNKIKVH